MQISQILDNIDLIMHRKNLLQKIYVPMYENNDIFAQEGEYTLNTNYGEWTYIVKIYDLINLIATVEFSNNKQYGTIIEIDGKYINKKDEIINKATIYAKSKIKSRFSQ